MKSILFGSLWRYSLLSSVFTILVLSISIDSYGGIFDEGDPKSGMVLFKANCAKCHDPGSKVKAAPGLGGISTRWGSSEELLVKWIQSPAAARETGDKYINDMYNTYKSQFADMTAQVISEQDVKDIMAYIQNPPDVVADTAGPDCPTIHDGPQEAESNTGIWFLILGILFVIVALSAAGINRSLQNAIRENDKKELLPHQSYWDSSKQWMSKNKVFVSLIGLFLVIAGATDLYIDAMGVGVYEGYEPDQPIAFNHSIHVCENNIDCEYCHHSARKSKHAGIPTTNVCMNCHKAIQEGKGGNEAGTAEIGKIYAAIGFDPESGAYIPDYEEQPVAWNKVHNLPDHVFFSHAQHVEVGGLNCRNCHGPVETFTVGRISPVTETNNQPDVAGLIQLSKPTLTMGWCIECHSKAQIDDSNEYYVQMHERMRSDERGLEELRSILEDEVQTVKEFGGWECAKCHY